MVSFAKIQFNPEQDNILDHMLMSGKKFKILNHKLNLLLQFQVDTVGRKAVSGMEVDILLKSQENLLKLAMEQIENKYEELLKNHAPNFEYDVAKERH